jgi:hypothetical protein
MNKNSKAVLIAIISVLSVVVIALAVLLVLEATGAIYGDADTVVITPPERDGSPVVKGGDYDYCLLKDGTVMITACALPSDTVTINVPEELGGYKVSAIGDSAFAFYTDLQSVRLPEGVTYIGKNAFFGAVNASLYLPSTLTQIEHGALAGFDEPAGIYYAGSAQQWAEVKVGDGNAALVRMRFEK